MQKTSDNVNFIFWSKIKMPSLVYKDTKNTSQISDLGLEPLSNR